MIGLGLYSILNALIEKSGDKYVTDAALTLLTNPCNSKLKTSIHNDENRLIK